jgi:hypothetical protein
MEPMRGVNSSRRGMSPSKQNANNDSTPEQLLDAFKAAALSVTKLYRVSAGTESKARMEGYQDCLDELLAYLDRENIGLEDGEGWKIRSWATERLDGRDSASQAVESEDDADKADPPSSPEVARSSIATHLAAMRNEAPSRIHSAPPSVAEITEEPQISVPTQDTFSFQSTVPYPQDAHLNLANLDLSDSRSHDGVSTHRTQSSIQSKSRNGRTGQRGSNYLNRGAGQKRKLNIAEIFDLGSLSSGKDVFGAGGGKRSRHV